MSLKKRLMAKSGPMRATIRLSLRRKYQWCQRYLYRLFSLLFYQAELSRLHSFSLPAAFWQENHPQVTAIRIVGRITWRSTHYLCHLSGSGRCTRRRRDLQHCIFHHNPISRHSRYYRLKGGTPAGTFYSNGKDRQ